MSTAAILNFGGKMLAREFEQVFSQFIYRTAYSVTGNHADAEDVLQTIFVKLLQRELTPRFWNEPRAYLYRAAVNLALNSVRSRKRCNTTNDINGLGTPAAPDAEALECIQQDLMAAIAQLKPLMVEVLVLRYGHDYSDVEIAKILGKSRGTVAVTLYRARARLKRRGGNLPFGFGCGGGSMQLGPARLVMITNLYTLVAMATARIVFPQRSLAFCRADRRGRHPINTRFRPRCRKARPRTHAVSSGWQCSEASIDAPDNAGGALQAHRAPRKPGDGCLRAEGWKKRLETNTVP